MGIGRIVFYLAVLAVIIFDGYSAYEQNQTRYWRKAEGIITAAHTEEKSVQRYDEYDDEYTATEYIPRLSYSYKDHRGLPWTGTRIRYWSRFESYDAHYIAEGILHNYQEGTRVIVFYHPQNPEKSLLEPASQRIPWLIVAILSMLGLVSLGRLLVALFHKEQGYIFDSSTGADVSVRVPVSPITAEDIVLFGVTLAVLLIFLVTLYPQWLMTIPR